MSTKTPTFPFRRWKAYADGSSGHQGDTSAEAEPSRRRTIDLAYRNVQQNGRWGITWKEFAKEHDLHHGQASSSLSNLHRNGYIVRLKERRNKCGIYVLNYPEIINERETVPYRSNSRPKVIEHVTVAQVNRDELVETIATWLYKDATIDSLADNIMELIYGTTTEQEQA